MSDVNSVITYLKKVCSIPRASGDERRISNYIADFARERGLEVLQDEYYNLIIKKPATVENAGGPLILQGHLDMVYVKENDSEHKYEEGIEVKEDEQFYFADGTSLGSDNGVALAYCLALLDSKDIEHPDLEIVLTVKEEVGLVGANVIDITSLKGKRFINLDSEEEGVFYSSCAGGLRCRMIWNIEWEQLPYETIPVKVSLNGLAGGHSGINIGMGLGNAIVLMGRLLYALKDIPVRINELDMPGKANAIANSGRICFYVKKNDLGKLREKLTEIERTFQEELQYTDSVSFLIEAGEAVKEASVYTERYQKEICHSLMLLPYGVTGYSFAIQGLIETSMNLGSLTCEDGKMTLLMSMRSSVASQKYMLRDKIQIIADANCDACIFESDYPGWQYRRESPLREMAIALYEEMFGKKAKVAAIHAGLECGYWDNKKPGMDIISIGPDLFDVHSTKEKVSKESIARTWDYLKVLIGKLAHA